MCAAIWAHAWLHLDETTAAAVLCRVPAGERVMLRAGTALRGVIHVAQPIHLKAEEGVTLRGTLHLQTQSETRHIQGVVEGLTCYHYMDEAVEIQACPPSPACRTMPS